MASITRNSALMKTIKKKKLSEYEVEDMLENKMK